MRSYLTFFEENLGRTVHVDELIERFGTQYNARTLETRLVLGCECKRGAKAPCTAKKHIVCVKDKHYKFAKRN